MAYHRLIQLLFTKENAENIGQQNFSMTFITINVAQSYPKLPIMLGQPTNSFLISGNKTSH